jgi:hypothetical protein
MSYTSDLTVGALTLENIDACNLPMPPLDPNAGRITPWFPSEFGFNITQTCSCNNCASACVA